MIDGQWHLRRSTVIQSCCQLNKRLRGGRSLALIQHRQADVPGDCRGQRSLDVTRVWVGRQRTLGYHGDRIAPANGIEGAEQLRVAIANVRAQPGGVE